MWFGQNFCLKILRRPSYPANFFDLTEDYITGCQLFILLYVVLFVSLQRECVASNQPLIFYLLSQKIFVISLFYGYSPVVFESHKNVNFLQKKLCHTNSLYNCCNGVYLICMLAENTSRRLRLSGAILHGR